MATAEQLKSLIRSHISGDPEHFLAVALRVAAHEAGQGHGALAQDIRKLIEKSRLERRGLVQKLPQDIRGLVLSDDPDTPKKALVIPPALRDRIDRIIHEYRQQGKLKTHGLSHRRKIMLIGPPGTGKTMSAQVLAHELRLTLHTIQVDRLVTKFMGETSAKLRQIFDLIQADPGVYLFDEFDAIGGERTLENDVGEMRRVLSAFLQFIEQDTSDSIIVAASNSPRLLDRALFRRFDDTLYYKLPGDNERKRLIQNVLGAFLTTRFGWKSVLADSKKLCHAEIDQACRDAIKRAILNDDKKVNAATLCTMLKERQGAHNGRRG
jgi:SpoVK/Ycf46/Vps4 family AAA+-type ATPase